VKSGKSVALVFVVGVASSILANAVFAWWAKKDEAARAAAPLPRPVVPGFDHA
jgi:F0F1-type ATP synthase assembly protein I